MEKVYALANEMLLEQKEFIDRWYDKRESLTAAEKIIFDEYSTAATTPVMTPEQRRLSIALREWSMIDLDDNLIEMKEQYREYFPEGWDDNQ